MKALIAALAIVLMSNLALAEKHEMKGSPDEAKLKEKLGLSDEQMAKLKELRKDKKDDKGQDRKKVKELQEAYQKAMKDPKTTNEELTKKFEALQAERNVMQRKHFDHMIQMRSILTPEQREKFHSMKGDHKGKKHHD